MRSRGSSSPGINLRYVCRFEGVTSESLVKEFLGPAPSGFDKIKGGDGSFKNRGALDIDTNMEASVGCGLYFYQLNITGNINRRP